MNEVFAHVVTLNDKPFCFVHLLDREAQACKTLNNQGQWQDAKLYSPEPPETRLRIVGLPS